MTREIDIPLILAYGYCAGCSKEDTLLHVGDKLYCTVCLNKEAILFDDRMADLLKQRDALKKTCTDLQVDLARALRETGEEEGNLPLLVRRLKDDHDRTADLLAEEERQHFTALTKLAVAERKLDDAVRVLRTIAFDISATPPRGYDETGDFYKRQINAAITEAANALTILSR